MSQFSWTQNLLQFGVVLSLPVIPKDGETVAVLRGRRCRTAIAFLCIACPNNAKSC